MNKIIQITLHGHEQPWNEAQAVCESTGGNLLRLDSKEKQHALTHYQTPDPTWQQHSGGEKWFGLHAIESSSNTYTWTYGKEACDEIENGTYIHWETGYPDKTSKKRCGKLPDGKGWKNTECKHDKKFLCERQLDADCTFNFANLVKPKASLSVVSQFTGDSTHTACTNNCLNSATNDMNCWAATFNLLLGECVLYYSEDPFLLSHESNLESSLLLYYTKQCFNASFENDAISIPAKSSFTSETPDEGCNVSIPVLSTTSTLTMLSSASTISSTQMPNSTHAGNSTISTHGTTPNPINAPFTTTDISTQATTSSLSSTSPVTETTTPANSLLLTIPSSASTGQSIPSSSLQTSSSTTEHISTTASQGTTTSIAPLTPTDISTEAATSALSSTSKISETTTLADSSILTIPSSASTGQSIPSSSLQTSSSTTEHISTTASQGTTTNIAPLTPTDISTQAATSALSSTSKISETTTLADSSILTIPSSASTGQSIPSSSLQTTSSTTAHISTTATQETTTNMTTLPSTGLLTQATTNPGSSSTTSMATSLQTFNATTSMQTQETLGSTTSSITSSSSPSTVSSVVQHSTSVPGNGSVSINDTICTCLLTDINNLYKANSIDMEFALLTSEEKVEKLQKRLKINKATLSASVRKKTSVMDTRTESMTVGVVSITVLSVIFGGLFISDVASIYHGIRYGV